MAQIDLGNRDEAQRLLWRALELEPQLAEAPAGVAQLLPLLHGEAMPWYPSVTLLRQQLRDDWQPVIEQVATRLAAWT